MEMGQTEGKYRWLKYSESRLIEVEKKILKAVKTAYHTWFVPVECPPGHSEKIWTILVNGESKNIPLVLLHGFAAGLCFWSPNFDSLAADRPVYAIDLLGFGRSTRPKFSSDCMEAEQEMVNSLEEWRKELNLKKFILLGHSFGGYLATSYAINYPDNIQHLILADPWGFTERPPQLKLPFWIRVIGVVLYPFTYLNPLAILRASGPIGPWLVVKTRKDIAEKFSDVVENKEIISEYIYHCNSQDPTGETAFQNMKQGFGWAKNPMIRRFHSIRDDVPVSVLYGERSWITKVSEEVFKEKRPNSYIHIEIILDAGHHVNADQPLIFNEVVKKICISCDSSDHEYDKTNIEKKNKSSSDDKKMEIEDSVEDTIDHLLVHNKKQQ